jgi:hypothetical protein
LVCSKDNAVAVAIKAKLNFIFKRLSTLMEQGRRIENQIKVINDLILELMKHHRIHSPPWKSGAVKKKQLIEEGKSQVTT